MISPWRHLAALLVVAVLVPTAFVPPAPASAQDVFRTRTGNEVDRDTVKARRFDDGRMWTFESPPLDYFERRYNFRPDDAWLERARLGTLRIPGCTASFVSPKGLMMTNHHCARDHAAAVARSGESILENGFYARSLSAERPAETMHADQLVAIADVTGAMRDAVAGAETDAERADARRAAADSIQQALADDTDPGDASEVRVEVKALYDGARYSAYTYRRYSDVRLVMIPEASVGYFGGDADNFTYPRYTLDAAFFRVYDQDGAPLETDYYFPFSTRGSRPGEATFVVGNPGSTLRLETHAQLLFRRDVQDVNLLRVLQGRVDALTAFADEEGMTPAVENQTFVLKNAVKLYEGRVRTLRDEYVMARIKAGDEAYRSALRSVDSLRRTYGGLLDSMRAIQDEKRDLAGPYRAFRLMTSPYASATLRRALLAVQTPPGSAQSEDVLAQIRNVGAQPAGLDRAYLADRLRLFESTLDSARVQQILKRMTPDGRAEVVVSSSVFADPDSAASVYESGSLPDRDPAVELVRAFIDRYRSYQSAWAGLTARQRDVAEQLGRARFAVYGTDVPPDATSSLRISDGVVQGYEYNGTIAPPFTTFFGMYANHHAHDQPAWDLPRKWLSPPDSFDRSTPLNLVSTNDITGGNSGSPLLNRDLEVVGLIFDGNIESLAGDFIYLPGRIRAVSVDVRGLTEALDEIYDADRLVQEATGGAFVESEAEAQ